MCDSTFVSFSTGQLSERPRLSSNQVLARTSMCVLQPRPRSRKNLKSTMGCGSAMYWPDEGIKPLHSFFLPANECCCCGSVERHFVGCLFGSALGEGGGWLTKSTDVPSTCLLTQCMCMIGRPLRLRANFADLSNFRNAIGYWMAVARKQLGTLARVGRDGASSWSHHPTTFSVAAFIAHVPVSDGP
jgi:hypothetical protein